VPPLLVAPLLVLAAPLPPLPAPAVAPDEAVAPVLGLPVESGAFVSPQPASNSPAEATSANASRLG
jgi:hypothetical protein